MTSAASSPLRVITVCNRKGSAGKTTTAVNPPAELAHLGWRVLLLDLDSQGHCAVGLGVKVTPQQPTVHSLFTDPQARLMDTVRETAFENLALAAADQLFEHGSGLRDELLLLNALSAANWVLVPFVPHPLSYEGVRQLMRMLFRVMSKQNPGLKLLGFLPLMAADHIRQHRGIIGDVARQFGAPRVLAGIRSDIKLAESFAAGLPVRYYAPSSRGAHDYAALAVCVTQLLGD